MSATETEPETGPDRRMAGYDVVIVETVGVGQSETAVAAMTDFFVLLTLPNAGDDLQAIKRGVMELADLVLINKADLDRDAATRAQAQITSSLRLMGQSGNRERAHHAAAAWQPRVLLLSALSGQGVNEFWQAVQSFRKLAAAERTGQRVIVPRPGQSVEPDAPPPAERWWPTVPTKTAAEDPIWASGMDSTAR